MGYIHANNISFSYDIRENQLFENLNFQIDKHNKIGLIGKNGCGKTIKQRKFRTKLRGHIK